MRPSRLFADLSDYQGRFDAHAYASAGHVLVAIKAGEHISDGGATHYHARVTAAHAAGLTVAHYWFCRPELGDPEGQADAFAGALGSGLTGHPASNGTFRDGDLLVADVETGDPGRAVSWLERFSGRLRARTGHTVVLYTYLSYASQAPALAAPGGRIWLAAYNGSRRMIRLGHGRRCWARQYSDGQAGAGPHTFAGIGRCDANLTSLGLWRDLRRQHRARRRAR